MMKSNSETMSYDKKKPLEIKLVSNELAEEASHERSMVVELLVEVGH